MTTATRRLDWDAGHRVLNHGGKCRYLHGHRYSAEVTVKSFSLDDLGMVVDFGQVKALVGSWIDEHLDHNVMLHPDDPLLALPDASLEDVLGGKLPFVMPVEMANPTAENIAHLIGNRSICLLQSKGIAIERVRIYETPNCWADWTP